MKVGNTANISVVPARLNRLVALEGIDGSGKSTLAKTMAIELSKRGLLPTILTWPQQSSLLQSSIITAIHTVDFDPYALQALFAAERLQRRTQLAEYCGKDNICIADRYRWSSYVYGVASGLDGVWAKSLESPLPEAGLTLLLDLPPELSLQRAAQSDQLGSDVELLRRCRQLYLELANSSDRWLTIDAKQTSTEVCADALSAILSNLSNSVE